MLEIGNPVTKKYIQRYRNPLTKDLDHESFPIFT